MKTEGRNAVREFLKSGKTADKILIQNGVKDREAEELLREIKKSGSKFQFAEKSVLDKESGSGRHQGFIVYSSDYSYAELSDIISAAASEQNSLIVVLDGIEDPHNLGSVIRVCECGGVKGVVIGKRRSAAVTDAVMRISEGSANHIPVARVTNVNAAIEEIKSAGIWTYALELGGENIYATDLTGRIAIVVGGEDTGVNRLTREKCDSVITIPMLGKVNSLNASVAAGVAVFEVARQIQNVRKSDG